MFSTCNKGISTTERKQKQTRASSLLLCVYFKYSTIVGMIYLIKINSIKSCNYLMKFSGKKRKKRKEIISQNALPHKESSLSQPWAWRSFQRPSLDCYFAECEHQVCYQHELSLMTLSVMSCSLKTKVLISEQSGHRMDIIFRPCRRGPEMKGNFASYHIHPLSHTQILGKLFSKYFVAIYSIYFF